MKIGVLIDTYQLSDPSREIATQARRAERDGIHAIWFQQTLGIDSGIAAAEAAAATDRVEVGIAVVPAPTRHPISTAQMALTVQMIASGRFSLGIGASHKPTMEQVFQLPFRTPVEALERYLDRLLPALRGEGEVTISPSRPPDVLLGAMGPRMLDLAGRRAEGTVTWLTGPRTLRRHIVPSITSTAAAAGRPSPRVVAALAVSVTDAMGNTAERIEARFAKTSKLPSYRAMLQRENALSPVGVAIFGDEDSVRYAIQDVASSGVTDLIAIEVSASASDADRTRALLGAMATEG